MTAANSKASHFFNRFRYVVLFLGLLCLTCIAISYSVINFTFICMTKDVNDVIPYGNATRQRYDYSTHEKSMIIWAVGVGTVVGMMPVNWASIRYGAKWTFFTAGMLSAATTALTPLMASIDLWALLALRFVQGIAYAADFAAIGVVVVRWAPIKQTAIFIGFLTSFTSISGMLTNPIAGAVSRNIVIARQAHKKCIAGSNPTTFLLFCESSLGWRSAFYFFSAFTTLCFVLWMLLYKDDPEIHRAVSAKELATIQRDKTADHINRDSFTPYWEICTNKVVLVVWLNAFGEFTGTVMIMTYAPIYINKVLGFSIGQTAYLSTLGSFFFFIFKISSGVISDKLNCMRERYKMIAFNTVAVGINGFLCAAIGLVPWPLAAVVCMSMTQALVGWNTGGFLKCGSLHSRQYGHFVLAMNQFTKSIALFLGPILVAIFVSADTDRAGWKIIFILMGVVMFIGNILFCIVATDQPAEFTKITRATKRASRASVTPLDRV